MYNQSLVGKTLSEAEALLADGGVTNVTVVRNDTKGDCKCDCDLVVKADVDGSGAVLTVSKFLLKV